MNAPEAVPRAKKILVVDDDRVILKALSMVLTLQGYDVFVATDGPEAVNIVSREKPDLIVLDIGFPPDATNVGAALYDGFFIAEWFRRMGGAEHIPIIIISKTDSPKFRQRALDTGAVAFFPKPIDNNAFLAAIRAALGQDAAGKTPGPV
jgi:DNA-binding response OmpR family regulator